MLKALERKSLNQSNGVSLTPNRRERLSAGRLTLFGRVRPFDRVDQESSTAPTCVQVEGKHLCLMPPTKPASHRVMETPSPLRFDGFDRVFNEQTGQQYVFEQTTCGPVRNLFRGQSHLILTYGVTSSGKVMYRFIE